MDDIAITVENVSKVFKLPHEKNSSIKSSVIGLYKRKKGYELQHALKDVSFEIKKGEFFGIVGRNGSGKSTLLKLLAGIYAPTSGEVHVRGSLTPFIELGVGFNPELTGRENVFLNGALLGFNRKDMQSMYGDIVEFAEIQKFMNQKLKNYSSGMQVRLAFSIAIRAKSDILLIDEVLAVGDTSFQQKCFDYFDKIKTRGTTVIFVSHDMDAVKRFCDKALLIDVGKVQFIGKPVEAADLYVEENEAQIISKLKKNEKWEKNAPLWITVTGQDGKSKDTFNYGDKLTVNLSWDRALDPQPRNAGIALFHEGRMVFGSNTGENGLGLKATKTSQEIKLNLGPGKYTIVAALFKGNNLSNAYVYEPRGPEFYIKAQSSKMLHWEGLTKLESKWLHETEQNNQ